MKKLIIFNWKMAPASLNQARTYTDLTQTYADKAGADTEIVIAPPLVYLNDLKLKTPAFAKASAGKQNLKLCAQDVFWENFGAYTGEISPVMLRKLGVEYVIIGHSERRQYLNETDEMINKKVLAALKAGLKVILCVGEEKRELGIKNYELRGAKNFVKKQLEKDLENIHNSLFKIHNSLIVTYEPIWAIGTGNPCHPKDALEMIKFIKSILNSLFKIHNSKVLYGGSVDSKNIESFIKYQEIDGALVGGASLKPKEVRSIIKLRVS